ncbi:threonine dehydratase [Pseudomonas panipatensis]|uniref:Threonine dehydratase n=1 Tax=Pseudomonas panipatensis TaxID=428992 RepID=A0A1G8GE34_9PSED|nr:threonine dehydratase [Pseudomonas panipatensis]SDH92610.1 threonine dehydratase [Pseudomonas panipatensis]SMP43852.1 threonine dehydratase [Pseudomonas panipatensis]
MPLSLPALEEAAAIVRQSLPATPQIRWPLLCQALGCDAWVKHENHSPVGAFKLRGGLVYFHHLAAQAQRPAGVISATRGNHGQSIAFAATRQGIPARIVVPHGNSREKNAAMRALGAELIEHGEDFQAAREHAQALATRDGLHLVPSYHPWLVAGVASYGLELFRALPTLDVAYVPIGMGSGICALIAARDALGLKTRIVGVVSAHAPAYALSFAAGAPVYHATSTQLADGMACTTPEPTALASILGGAAHIVQVTDEEVGAAMRLYFSATHNVAEGAGAAALAAALQEREALRGLKVGLVLSGGNVDRAVYARELARAD